MNLSQFRILYRVFLLRIVDMELLSSDADPTRLIGQFLAIFASISFLFVALLLFIAGSHLPITSAWMFEHFFIENSMTAAGIILVLNWDAAFPDRRDALVLSPLPIRPATVFFAKITALLVAPSLAVIALNIFIGLIWPALFCPAYSGFPGLLRSVFAYWLSVFLASGFIVFFFLAIQGLAANLLPRQLALRLSAILQASALCFLLLVYLLEPSLESPAALAAPQNQHLLAWLPSYWFLGLFQQLNGSMRAEFIPLAHRAWVALGISVLGAFVSLLLSYFRALPKIVEQPDILPVSRALVWPPRIGSSLQMAISMFTLRTLLRSRQHRMILSFYIGVGLAIVAVYLKVPLRVSMTRAAQINPSLLIASILMLILVVFGIRVVASFPVTLSANWIIRITQLRPGLSYQRAIRFSWLMLGVAPVSITTGALLLTSYGWKPVAMHLAIMCLMGVLLVEACLYTFPKIPFTCSYLPGKANIHLIFWTALFAAIQLPYYVVKFEEHSMRQGSSALVLLGILFAVSVFAHIITRARFKTSQELLFEESYGPEVVTLNLR